METVKSIIMLTVSYVRCVCVHVRAVCSKYYIAFVSINTTTLKPLENNVRVLYCISGNEQ